MTRNALLAALLLAAAPAAAQQRIEVIDPAATTPRVVIVRIDGRYYSLATTPVESVDPQPQPIPPTPEPTPVPIPVPPPPTPPPVPPSPDVQPYKGKLWVLYVAPQSDGPSWDLATDPQLRTGLGVNNAELRTYKPTESDIARIGLNKPITDAGGPPVVFVQRADGTLARTIKPVSKAAILEAITAVREGRSK